MMWACPAPPPPALPPCVVHEARHLARSLHDRHPKWIHAVETTYDQADAAISGRPPAAPGGGDVVFIEIKGRLLDDFDPTPPFRSQPFKGRFYVLVLERATCTERIRGIGSKGVKLRPLGNVTSIE